MLDKKLQLKDNQSIAIIGEAVEILLEARRTTPNEANAVLAFVRNQQQLQKHLRELKTAARDDKLTWVAYPKAGQLDTDINRDSIRDFANANGLDPVRQIAINDIWSALRLKTLQ